MVPLCPKIKFHVLQVFYIFNIMSYLPMGRTKLLVFDNGRDVKQHHVSFTFGSAKPPSMSLPFIFILLMCSNN
jgi:hypothetical protein